MEEVEKNLTEAIKEEKRMQANQFKVEGNNLYKEGRTAGYVYLFKIGHNTKPSKVYRIGPDTPLDFRLQISSQYLI